MVLSIQYLRGLAALMVLLSHAAWKGEQYAGNPLSWFHIGHAGVDIFFVISGYVMCHTTRQRLGRPFLLGHFVAHRLGRILPLYWILSVVALGIYWMRPEMVNSGAGGTDVWSSFLLWPSDRSYLIQAGWTLSYELFFYGLFALSLCVSATWGGVMSCGVLAGLFVLGRVFEQGGLAAMGQWMDWRFLTDAVLVNFIYGIALFHLNRRWQMPLAWAGVLLLVGVLGFVAVNQGWLDGRWRCFKFGIPAFLLCLGATQMEGLLRKRPSALWGLLGDASYSVYLIHPFALALGAQVLRKVGVHAHGTVFVGLLVLFSVWMGVLCYRWLEQPLMKTVRGRIDARLA